MVRAPDPNPPRKEPPRRCYHPPPSPPVACRKTLLPAHRGGRQRYPRRPLPQEVPRLRSRLDADRPHHERQPEPPPKPCPAAARTPAMRRFLGTEEDSISYSQLARSSTSRPSEFFEGLLPSLLPRPRGRRRRSRASSRRPFWRTYRLLDSTFFPLGAKASSWSVWDRRGDAGARLQTLLDPTDRLPTEMRLELLCHQRRQRPGELGPLRPAKGRRSFSTWATTATPTLRGSWKAGCTS